MTEVLVALFLPVIVLLITIMVIERVLDALAEVADFVRSLL